MAEVLIIAVLAAVAISGAFASLPPYLRDGLPKQVGGTVALR
jgi:hypothetical protein